MHFELKRSSLFPTTGAALHLYCPGCGSRVSRALLHELLPAELEEWDTASTALALSNYSRWDNSTP